MSKKTNTDKTDQKEFDADLHPSKVSKESDEDYTATDLAPGGSGKVGNQQEFGQSREQRKDKSHSDGDSDKEHGE